MLFRTELRHCEKDLLQCLIKYGIDCLIPCAHIFLSVILFSQEKKAAKTKGKSKIKRGFLDTLTFAF